jgi:hypothetical protein
MKILALWLLVLALSIYAWRDWYKSLCGLIVLTAVVEHPDMPRTILGVPGLNPWNLLFFSVVLAWMSQRKGDGLRWDMPRVPAVLLLLGLSLVVTGFFRVFADAQSLVEADVGVGELVSDYLFNPVKWVVLGLLLFDGCRNRGRLVLGLASILSLYFMLGLQVLRWVLPTVAFDGNALSSYTVKKLTTEIGHHRNDLSVMLAGASWSFLALRPLVASTSARAALLLGGIVVLVAQALTGGRGGYLAWCAVGLVLALVRWRRYLVVAPLIVILVISFMPSVADRALHGIVGPDDDTDEINLEELTSGRNFIWPPVIDKISEARFVGHGRAAMQRTGLSVWLMEEAGEGYVNHPHNAYLEMLLDSGVLGLFVTLALYTTFLAVGLSLTRDRRSPEFTAAGCIALALVTSHMVGSLSGQSFWPREATVGMWSAAGLLLRVWVQRSRSFREPRGDDGTKRSASSRSQGIWPSPSTAGEVVVSTFARRPSQPGQQEWHRAALQH